MFGLAWLGPLTLSIWLLCIGCLTPWREGCANDIWGWPSLAHRFLASHAFLVAFLPAASRFGAIGADDIRGLGPAWLGPCSPLTLSRLHLHRLLHALARRTPMVFSAECSLAHLLARLSRFLGCFVPAASRFGAKVADDI